MVVARRVPVAEITTPYGARPEGSHSKLGTWTGGLRVLTTLLRLFVAERPLLVYGSAGAGFVALSLGLGLLMNIARHRKLVQT